MWILIALVLFLLLIIAISLTIIIPIISGAPFYRTRETARETMFEFAGLKPGEKVIDLGSGDGILVIEAAQKGFRAEGYEISPWLVWHSRRKIQKRGIQEKATIHKTSLWKADVSRADVIFLFGIPHMMEKLEKKLLSELKPGSRIVSFTFSFPNLKPIRESDNVRLYVV